MMFFVVSMATDLEITAPFLIGQNINRDISRLHTRTYILRHIGADFLHAGVKMRPKKVHWVRRRRTIRIGRSSLKYSTLLYSNHLM